MKLSVSSFFSFSDFLCPAKLSRSKIKEDKKKKPKKRETASKGTECVFETKKGMMEKTKNSETLLRLSQDKLCACNESTSFLLYHLLKRVSFQFDSQSEKESMKKREMPSRDSREVVSPLFCC